MKPISMLHTGMTFVSAGQAGAPLVGSGDSFSLRTKTHFVFFVTSSLLLSTCVGKQVCNKMNVDLSKAAIPAGSWRPGDHGRYLPLGFPLLQSKGAAGFKAHPALTTQSDTCSVLLVPNRLVCRGMPFDQHLTLRRREACFQKKRLKSGN